MLVLLLILCMVLMKLVIVLMFGWLVWSVVILVLRLKLVFCMWMDMVGFLCLIIGYGWEESDFVVVVYGGIGWYDLVVYCYV